MTRLFNEPAAFADEMIEGFAASHGRWVKRVSGGVVRNTKSTPDTVALVIGGGSGHYPAFAGLVGQGLAHGAAMGNLFASPSAQQVYNVAKAANNGGGVLLGYGNYAGDVLHFNQAQDKLRKEGIDCRKHRRHRRRLLRATDRTRQAQGHRRGPHRIQGGRRSCRGRLHPWTTSSPSPSAPTTAPGPSAWPSPAAPCPVPTTRCFPSRKGVWPSAWASTVNPASARRTSRRRTGSPSCWWPSSSPKSPNGSAGGPAAPRRVVPILNGLGAVKYEELFVVYRRVAQLLAEAGLEAWTRRWASSSPASTWPAPPSPSSGSTTNSKLLWNAPADAPAFRRGAVAAEALERIRSDRH